MPEIGLPPQRRFRKARRVSSSLDAEGETLTDAHDATGSSGPWNPHAPGAALFDAIDRDDLASVRGLLSEGFDVNAFDPRWPPPFATTALIAAACRGNSDMVALLLSHGADVDGRDGGGGTALIWACNAEKLDCARLLLDAGADPSLRNNDGYTAYGRTPLRNKELVRLIREHGGT